MEEKKKMPLFVLFLILLVAILLISLVVLLILGKDEGKEEAAQEESSIEVTIEEDEDTSADEYNNLSFEEREPITKEEFDALPDDEKYDDPKTAYKELIPGILPTKEQALSYLYEDAIYCYNVIGIFSAIPVVLTDPWESDGGWCCYINNEVGTTVLWAYVNKEGKTSMGLYGSEYVKDFVGIMYNVKGDNPDAETIEILENKIYKKYGDTKKLKIKSFSDTHVCLENKEGKETIIDLTE